MGGLSLNPVRTPIADLVVFEPDRFEDQRGAFTRLFCREVYAELGLDPAVAQMNLSRSPRKGTLRGMHYQAGDSAETKTVPCLAGAVHDVVLDLRPDSASFGRSVGVELSERSGRVLAVPEGCAHGFLTLEDDASLLYLVSSAYDPAAERGVRYDDPVFAIAWPTAPAIVSAKDLSHPLWPARAAERVVA